MNISAPNYWILLSVTGDNGITTMSSSSFSAKSKKTTRRVRGTSRRKKLFQCLTPSFNSLITDRFNCEVLEHFFLPNTTCFSIAKHFVLWSNIWNPLIASLCFQVLTITFSLISFLLRRKLQQKLALDCLDLFILSTTAANLKSTSTLPWWL